MRMEGIVSKFAEDIKLWGAVDSLRVTEALQRDLDESESWAVTNHVEFNSAGFCSWDGVTLGVWIDWGLRCWKAVQQKGMWDPAWLKAEQESAVTWKPGGLSVSWSASGITSPAKRILVMSPSDQSWVQFDDSRLFQKTHQPSWWCL